MYHTTFVFAILSLYVFCSCIEKSNSLRISSLLFHAYCELVLLVILCLHSTSCSIFNLIVSLKHFISMPHIFSFFFPGRGIYILYKDVKSCPCEDVQVLWSILVESHSHTPSLPSTWWSCLSYPIENHKRGRFHFMYIYKYYIILMRNPFTFCCLPVNYEPYVPFHTFCKCCFSSLKAFFW